MLKLRKSPRGRPSLVVVVLRSGGAVPFEGLLRRVVGLESPGWEKINVRRITIGASTRVLDAPGDGVPLPEIERLRFRVVVSPGLNIHFDCVDYNDRYDWERTAQTKALRVGWARFALEVEPVRSDVYTFVDE